MAKRRRSGDSGRLGVTLGLRLDAADADRLNALAERIPVGSRHSIARAALRLGLDALAEDPSRIIAPAPRRRGGR
ncbi:MAG: hypothetical protein HY744_13285 [Deltaproteobacteria bacterium]|nr:hypothetical protein [Deltaproteobacteria bacterium]